MSTLDDLTRQNIQEWERRHSERRWGRYPPEELIRCVARTFPEGAGRKNLRVLEVGCGPGPNLWYLAREGFSIAGIDGSPTAIATARKRLAEEGLTHAAENADLRAGNFASLPWADASFDLVVDIEAIYANTPATIDATLGEVRRVLKEGGWFFSKMFGPETTGILSGALVDQDTSADPVEGVLAGTGLSHAFTEAEIKSRFAAYRELMIDWVKRTDRGRFTVFEWVVQARK